MAQPFLDCDHGAITGISGKGLPEKKEAVRKSERPKSREETPKEGSSNKRVATQEL